MGYHHPPQEIFFNANFTTHQECDSSGEDKECSNKYFPDFTMDDHDFYFESISGVKCWFMSNNLIYYIMSEEEFQTAKQIRNRKLAEFTLQAFKAPV